jgi:hypothetical protein
VYQTAEKLETPMVAQLVELWVELLDNWMAVSMAALLDDC